MTTPTNRPATSIRRSTQAMLAAIPVLAFAASAAVYAATAGALPDRFATHFSGSTPDGSMSLQPFLVWNLVLLLLGALLLGRLAITCKPWAGMVNTTLGFLGGFLVGLGAGVFSGTMVSHHGLRDWQQASPWLPAVATVVVSLGLGMIAARVSSRLPSETPSIDEADRPTMDLSPGQQAVWTAASRSGLLEAIGMAACAFVILGGIATRAWWITGLLGIATLAVVALARVRVRADHAGLQVQYSFLPWPKTTVPIDRIKSATVIDVRPMDWGGWGYRGSLKLIGQAAVVHRSGPGIRLDLVDGKTFVVTVDDPETGAALLNAKIKRFAAA